MKSNIYILIVEDELEVMDALVKDLEKYESAFPIETANDATEAQQVIDKIIGDGDKIGLVLCDHVLPGKNGVNLLIEMQDLPETAAAKKVLVTGQAGHEDTILAVNKADLDHYIAKPWSREELEETVEQELTDFVIEQEKELLPYMSVLNTEKLSAAIRKNQMTDH